MINIFKNVARIQLINDQALKSTYLSEYESLNNNVFAI